MREKNLDGVASGCRWYEGTPIADALGGINGDAAGVTIAILCALYVCKEEAFILWAKEWLAGKNRSCEEAGKIASLMRERSRAHRALESDNVRIYVNNLYAGDAGWAAFNAASAAAGSPHPQSVEWRIACAIILSQKGATRKPSD